MSELKRQDIQCVNIKAEQLVGLSQTLFEYHDKLDWFQLKKSAPLFMTWRLIFITGPKRKKK